LLHLLKIIKGIEFSENFTVSFLHYFIKILTMRIIIERFTIINATEIVITA